MFDFLVDHALKNVWCTPDQDLQAIVQLARLTGPTGVFGQIDVMWRRYALPRSGVRFHVFQIGQLNPAMMGLLADDSQVWIRMDAVCAAQNLIANIYNTNGLQIPRAFVWYMVTANKNLIIAIQDQPKIAVKLGTEDVFLRVYSNAYFQSVRANAATDYIKTEGVIVSSTADILAMQNKITTLSAQPGYVSRFVNGRNVSAINLLTATIGDVIEYLYDASIQRVVQLNLSDLPTFNSTIDSKHKYLLHYAGLGDNEIDFYDDIDIYILKRDSNGRSAGVYYHRNQPDAVRMVTHKDYALPVAYVLGYVNQQWTDTTNIYVEMRIRKSGYDRPLVNENNRIKELYKLSDADVVGAMVGVNAVVDNWKAEVLEAAMYPALMRSEASDISSAMVQAAYGYNAISKLLANTPAFSYLHSDQATINVPYGLQTRAIGYEYDQNGVLVGWFSHSKGSTYTTRDLRTKLVEMIAGAPDDKLDETYGSLTVNLDPSASYRMYVCPVSAGVPSNVWQDVTDSGMYSISNNKLTWLIDPTQYYPMVRSDKIVLSYTLALAASRGAIRFSLTHRQLRNGAFAAYVMQIPMGELDLWLNGYSLIEGVDYVVKFPEIVIINTERLKNPLTDLQQVDVRFSGFCNSDLTRNIPKDVGFVEYGALSHNNRFDIRDDKVLRIVVRGEYYDRSELRFTESSPDVLVPDARNGSPYMIRDIVVPLRGATQTNTYTLRAISQVIDKQISDYMTLKLPQVTEATPSVIPGYYPVLSPFFCSIFYDLQNGVLDDPRLKDFYTDQDVLAICKPYEYLLKYDPTQEGNRLDDRYVIVLGHNQQGVVDMSVYYYKFLSRVNAIYLGNMVQMSHFFRVTA